MNSHLFLTFLKRLVKDSPKKIFLIIDNLPVHHSKPIKNGWRNILMKLSCFICHLVRPSSILMNTSIVISNNRLRNRRHETGTSLKDSLRHI
ncbi:MAG: hypothetical protein JW786_03965 [Desulfobacterales bacterium]|nr:hypothetical protein [Desulfobacterales bacterium]